MALGSSLMLLGVGYVKSQAVMEPPFGLCWGDSPEKLISWATRQSLDVTIQLQSAQPAVRILKIQAKKGCLPDTQVGSIEGHFLTGKLYELTIHYFDENASSDVMESRFETVKKQFVRERGVFLTNQQLRTVDNQFATRTQSFHREPVKGLFQLLVFTEVEDLLRKTKNTRFSIVYKNNNFEEQLLKL